MKTILLVPTGEGVGLTSACLGLIYALECQGIKAGFLKPFSQEAQAKTEDRTAALYKLLLKDELVEQITFKTLTKRLNKGEKVGLFKKQVGFE